MKGRDQSHFCPIREKGRRRVIPEGEFLSDFLNLITSTFNVKGVNFFR